MGSMINETEFNESQAIIDALSGGKKLRQEKIKAINRKQRKYKGIYRVQDGNKCYWMLDELGNPQLKLEEQTIIRLTPDGVRVYFPEWLPQNTVLNKIKRVIPEYGWNLDWNADRELMFVPGGKRKAYERKIGVTYWWYATKAQQREFYSEYGVRFENNMLIPYTSISGTCEWIDWRVTPQVACNNTATSISRWGEVLCDEHYRGS